MEDGSVPDRLSAGVSPQDPGLDASPDQDEESTWLANHLEALARASSQQPEATDRLLAMFGRTLGSPLDDGSYPQLLDAVTSLLGPDSAELLNWVIDAPVDRLALAEASDDGDSIRPFRLAIAMYGRELVRAYDLATQLADDWKTVQQNAFYDYLTERFVLRARIVKYDGSSLLVESTPSGMLDLIRALAKTLHAVGRREAFSDTAISAYLAEADKLRALLADGDEASPDESGVEAGRLLPPGS